MHTLSKQQDDLYREKFAPVEKRSEKDRDEHYHKNLSGKIGASSENKPYSIHKHIALAGVDVAVRPKYQLVASVIYMLNFWFRKVDRKEDLFKMGAVSQEEAEKAYDSLLDDILKGFEANYGNDEVNHVLDLVKLRRGHDSLFQEVLREKTLRRKEYGVMKKQNLDRLKRDFRLD